ncbi:MAG: hypothetical protein LBK95_07915 [Bifidobacteriaceae bacterium]|jgi:hypothetical protein|nr:hypothetical protein [Bifidobacteriaceae bacterium]
MIRVLRPRNAAGPTRRILVARAVVAGAVAVTACAACSAPTESGPLDSGGEGDSMVQVCTVEEGQARALGTTWALNTDSKHAITLGHAQLVNAQDIELVGQYIIRSEEAWIYGGGIIIPPTVEGEGDEWVEKFDSREELAGASIAPGEGVNLVLALRQGPTGTGSADAFLVPYTSNGHQYRLTVTDGMVFDRSGLVCD